MVVTAPDYLAQGLSIIQEAENGLRGLLARAAEDGDYDVVASITAWAKQIRGIADGMALGKMSSPKVPTEPPASSDYPRFFKNDNKLIMVGWSRKLKTEYEHKAPREVLDQLVPVLLDCTANGDPITVKEILPHLKGEDGSVYPDYYARTFLRWMLTLKLLEKHGHRGYSAKNRENFESIINSNWRRLAEK